MKIIPAIDIRGGNCVRLFQGDYARETVYGTDPAAQAKAWQDAGAEIIHLVDLDGAKAGHPVNLEAIEAICKNVTVPCELGGGIRTVEDAKKVLDLGISRVILGTVACDDPKLAESFISQFGTEKIVVGIDAKDGKVATRGWIETSSTDAFELARKLYLIGVSRIIYTDIATDGALCGPNLKSVANLCDLIPECHVIASGGVSSAKDIANLNALGKANLEGAIVGKALYDGRVTFADLDIATKA